METLSLAGCTGESLEVWQELDLQLVEQDLRRVQTKGISSLAVLLLHSYTCVLHYIHFMNLLHGSITWFSGISDSV